MNGLRFGTLWHKNDGPYKDAELYISGKQEWTLVVASDHHGWIRLNRTDLQELHKAIGDALGL